jgi:uncharacterized membrane protein
MSDSPQKKKKVTGWQRSMVIGIDRAILGFARNWLLSFNLIVGIYVGLPILAPALMQAGITGPARAIYAAYSPMCHQMATRSFFLFGDQYAYPRELADVESLEPFEVYAAQDPTFAGIDLSNDNWEQVFARARGFLGNDTMGYKMALCERDIAIYGAILLFGLLYAGFRRWGKRIPPLPLWAFILIGMVPIGLDGFSQLFGYFGLANNPIGDVLGLFPLRESTPFLRTATGAWFGFCLAWLAYPNIAPGMRETARELQEKLTKAGVLKPPSAS